MSRERLGIVTRSDGQKFEVILLKMADLKGLNLSSPDLHLDLCARSLRIERSEFDSWDMDDGMKVLNLVSQALTTLGKI